MHWFLFCHLSLVKNGKKKMLKKTWNKILDRQKPEMLLRNCIYNKESTNLADMNESRYRRVS